MSKLFTISMVILAVALTTAPLAAQNDSPSSDAKLDARKRAAETDYWDKAQETRQATREASRSELLRKLAARRKASSEDAQTRRFSARDMYQKRKQNQSNSARVRMQKQKDAQQKQQKLRLRSAPKPVAPRSPSASARSRSANTAVRSRPTGPR